MFVVCYLKSDYGKGDYVIELLWEDYDFLIFLYVWSCNCCYICFVIRIVDLERMIGK